MTIKLTPNAALGAVDIETSPTPARLIRSDRNGVQTFTPTSPTMRDMTCALDGPVEYRAVMPGGVAEVATVNLAAGAGTPRLLALRYYQPFRNTVGVPDPEPTMPLMSYVPTATWTDFEALLDITDQHDGLVVAAPILNSAVPYTYRPDQIERRGTLVLWVADGDAALRARAALDTTPLRYVRMPDRAGLDRAVAVTSTVLDRDGAAWTIRAEYVELGVAPIIPPTAEVPVPRLSDVRSTFGTLGDIAVARATLADLRGGAA